MKKKHIENEKNQAKTIFGVINRYVREIPFINRIDLNRLLTQNTIEELLFSNILYTMNISNAIYGCRHVFSEIFKTVTKTMKWNRLRYTPESTNLPYTKEDFRAEYDVNDEDIALNNVHVTFYKNRPIFLVTISRYHKNNRIRCSLLATFRTKDAEDFLVEFIAKSCEAERKYNQNHFIRTIDSITPEGKDSWSHRSTPVRGNYCRSFNDVFIEDEVLDKIKLGIESFISKREWYCKHHIPYHYGIILYGEPGTGKSSIAQAIAKEYDMTITDIDTSVPNLIPDMIDSIKRNFASLSGRTQILLIEDIDCAMLTKEYDENGKMITRGSNLGSLLNELDGISAVNNIIYIFTTNHIEKLDPALIRPGRMDLKLEIKYVTFETLNKFLNFHYGKTVTKKFKVKDGITFAELQVMVMQNATIDDIVKFCKEKKVIKNDKSESTVHSTLHNSSV